MGRVGKRERGYIVKAKWYRWGDKEISAVIAETPYGGPTRCDYRLSQEGELDVWGLPSERWNGYGAWKEDRWGNWESAPQWYEWCKTDEKAKKKRKWPVRKHADAHAPARNVNGSWFDHRFFLIFYIPSLLRTSTAKTHRWGNIQERMRLKARNIPPLIHCEWEWSLNKGWWCARRLYGTTEIYRS